MQYTYDFNYSLHLEHMPHQHSPPISQDKQFSLASKALLEANCIKTADIRQFVALLLRQPIFSKIGINLLRLSQFELGLTPKNVDSMQQMQALRQQLCESIKEMNVILGRQRQYYINVIILCLNLIISRSLNQKHQADIKQQVLFHLLHWQLKGQHSTNVFYQRMQQDLLIQANASAFSQGIQTKNQQSLGQSLSFRQLYSSFTSMKIRSSTSGFALTLNKQNQNLHNKVLSGGISLRVGGLEGKDAQRRQENCRKR